MVITFSVSNFLSFSSEQTISFQATKDRSHRDTHCVPTSNRAIPSLTRNALIMGSNASGKSNFLLALRTMRELVLHSTGYAKTGFYEQYHPFNSLASQSCATTFEINLLFSDIRYQYAFSYDIDRVVAESMRVYPHNKAQRWFDRRFDSVSGAEVWTPFSNSFHGPREMWRAATSQRALFLTAAAQLNSSQCQLLVHWFEHQLNPIMSSTDLDVTALSVHLKDAKFKARLLSVLQVADFPVVDVRIVKPDAGVDHQKHGAPSIDDSLKASVELHYVRQEWPPIWIDVKHDSSGLRRLIGVLAALIDGVEHDRFVAIDHFDTYLHPLLARLLVQLINDPETIHRRVQVLMVSHTTALMDLAILRRDEIWLMDTDKTKASHLTALVLHGARKAAFLARDYLDGEYGGVPHIAAGTATFTLAKKQRS